MSCSSYPPSQWTRRAVLCRLGDKPDHTHAPPSSSDHNPSSRPLHDTITVDQSDPLESNYTDFSVFLAADKLMQLSGRHDRGERSSQKAHKIASMNGIVKQSALIKKENPSSDCELHFDASTPKHDLINGTVTSRMFCEPADLDETRREGTKNDSDSGESKMEVHVGGDGLTDVASKSETLFENHDGASLEEGKRLYVSSKDGANDVGGEMMSVNGGLVKEKEEKEGVSDGELLAEDKMEVCGDERSESEDEEGEKRPLVRGYEPNFGKIR